MKLWPFKVINKSNKPYIQVTVEGKKKEFAAEEISAMILSKMKEIAEAFLGRKVTNAVVTVPVYFSCMLRVTVMQHFIKLIKQKHKVDLSNDHRAIAKLRREVEKAKRALSTVHQVKVEIESLVNGEDFSETLVGIFASHRMCIV